MVKYCLHDSCDKRPHFGDTTTKIATYCKFHKLPDHENVTSKHCLHPECAKQPKFGDPIDGIRVYCGEHKMPHHEDLSHKLCIQLGCKKRALFGSQAEKISLYCADHKRPDDRFSQKKKNCMNDACETIPTYGFRTDMKATHCAKHRLPDQYDVRHKLCLEPSCDLRPTYGCPSTKIAQYCVQHKQADDVDVISLRCQEATCDKGPSFGDPIERKIMYCFEHKLPGHVNVVSKRCGHADCDKIPTFGHRNNMQELYCATHKLPDHVQVQNKKKCIEVSCNTIPSFGNLDDRKVIYCAKHKLPDHVNLVQALCIQNGCTNTALYGKLFEARIHCSQHRTKQELRSNPKCTVNCCKERPFFTNADNNWPLRCELHQLSDDKNIVEKLCASCHTESFIKEGNTLCTGCTAVPWTQRVHLQENKVAEFLKSKNIDFIQDKRADTSCSLKRPDFSIDYGTHMLIVEVDENQHQSYPCECEQSRMLTIFNDLGGLPVTFIRYNPDNYVDYEGKAHSGKMEDSKKLARLLSVIKSVQLHPPQSVQLQVIHLFYDGDDGTNVVETIDYEKSLSTSHRINKRKADLL